MTELLGIQSIMTYPYDDDLLLRKQKKIRRQLLERTDVSYVEKRIAILNGSTTDDLKNLLDIFLLYSGIKATFYQSEYNKYYEDAIFGNPELDEFHPNLIIFFTSVVNVQQWPQVEDDKEAVAAKLDAEYQRWQVVWEAARQRYGAVIIQNNIDPAWQAPLGSLEAAADYGRERYVAALNERFAAYAVAHDDFYIHDLHRLAATIGLMKWHNRFQYYAYKFAVNYDAVPEVANGLAKIIRAIYGKNKKCLVLDLDNTLWGGVIGDEGVENIAIGHETPTGEAYTAFQQYVKELKDRGVILAVCSKNEEDIAKEGFSHPDSVLHVDDFVAFHANWEPKNVNIEQIAREINIGLDSLVFIDDNPAERQIVRDTLPEVAVPEVDVRDVFSYIRAIEGAGYFETVKVSDDDRKRNAAYMANKERRALASIVTNYDDFLKSLQMKAEIDSFRPVYYDRIAQLTNKSNQFNLTTQRYTRADIERMAENSNYITLYGRLSDKFGDNGLISVVIGEKQGNTCHIRLWLMSCRVLKRGMEQVMLDAIVERAKAAGCTKLVGYYYQTKKNKMVADLYQVFGFTMISEDDADTTWQLDITDFTPQGKFIEVHAGEVKES